jgi:hypothetical protein
MKKTNKENPLVTFRKANEARKAVVMKSMKKAQDGIEMNDDMINKAGSTGGYKKPVTMGSGKRAAGYANMIKSANTENANSVNKNTPASSNFRGPQALNARSASLQGQGMRGTADTISKVLNTYSPQIINKQKRGGSVKTKKK